MKRLISFPIACIVWPAIVVFVFPVIAALAIYYGAKPPSDDMMIAHFTQHRSQFDELVRVFIEDRRLANDHRRLNQVGVSSLSGDSASVSFQASTPLPIFLAPSKFYRYSLHAPRTVTSEDTENYPGRYRNICRPIPEAEDWYVCLDETD